MQRLKLLVFVLLALVLSACSSDPQAKAQRYVENGNKFYEREKYKEASIMYRRAIAPNAAPRYGEAHYRLGLTFLKLSDLGSAYRSFLNAVDLQPDNADALIKTADIEVLAGSQGGANAKLLDDAEGRAQKLLSMKGGAYDGYRILGQLALIKKNPAEAVKNLRQANALKTDEPGLMLAYFQALVQDNQFPEAEKIAKEMLAKKKDYAPMYDLLYIQYATRRQWPEAEAVLVEKVANNTDSGQFILELGAHYAVTNQRARMDETLARLGDSSKYLNGRLLAGDFYLLRLREFDRAQKEYEAGIQAFPKEKATYQKRLVELFANTNRSDEANKLLAVVLKDNPDDPDAVAIRSALRLTTGTREEINLAANDLQGLVTKTPNNHLLRYNLARALLAKGEIDPARLQLEAAVKLRGDFLQARELLARIHLSRNDAGKALEEADQIIQRDPKSLAGHLARSSALLLLKDKVKAREELNFITATYPQNVEARYQIGYLAYEEKDYVKASQVFGELHKANPKDLRGLVGVVETLAGQNRMPDALREMEAASAAEPDRRDLKVGVANLYVRMERYDDAVKNYSEVLAKNPKDADILFKLAETYRRKGDLNTAIETFRKASQANPNDTGPLLQLGLLMDGTGRREQSKPIYEQILRIDGGHAVALNNLAYIKAEEGADLDVALQMAQRATQTMPNSPDISDTLGWVYIKKGLNSEAIRIFTDLVKKAPANPLYRMHYGMALAQKGDRPAAKRELETALRNEPSKDEAARIQEMLKQL
ncbi:MAG: tetratricopeptide repeat protein [Acidobacteriota bacterium]